MADAVQWMTYAELAKATGIGVESARNLVRRKRWQRRPGNDGAARIAVPIEHLQKPRGGTGSPTDGGIDAPSAPPTDTPTSAPINGGIDASSAIMILTQHIALLQAEIIDLRAKAAERDALAGELEAIRVILQAEKHLTGELQAMLEQLRQERDADRHKVAEHEALARQLDALRATFEASQQRETELREERDRWAVQAHVLAHPPVPPAPPVVERRGLFGWLRRAG
jgi:hypothetical protein